MKESCHSQDQQHCHGEDDNDSSSQYIQEACKNVRNHLKLRNKDDKLQDCKYFLPQKAPGPMTTDYRAEIDVSPELNATDAAYY